MDQSKAAGGQPHHELRHLPPGEYPSISLLCSKNDVVRYKAGTHPKMFGTFLPLHFCRSENSDAVNRLNSIFKQQNGRGRRGGEAIVARLSSSNSGLILNAADKESASVPLRELLRFPETPILSGFGSLTLHCRCFA
ncbi:hypothetical protein SAY86_027257 [Trapa natans]|uniref:Uncharacterized protein n=1 Tax=Trapa natans TaxID=22666 RepID=A0AAN7KM37_TRANT|nr:hypothetical protein SAY86_027257 [Trapa natans]